MLFHNPFASQETENLQKDINMIPLIDVLLVLLVLFIIALPVVHPNIPLNLPAVSSEMPNASTEPVSYTVSLNQAQQYFWNQEPISLEQLQSMLQKLNPLQSIIHLEVDASVSYEQFTQLLAKLQDQGLHNIRLQTKHSIAP